MPLTPPMSPDLEQPQVRPPEVENPLATIAQLQALKQHRLQSAMAQIEMREKQMEMGSEQNLMRIWAQDAQGDPEKTLELARRSGQVLPKHVMTFGANLTKMATDRAKLTQTELENKVTQNGLVRSLLDPVLAEEDPVKQQKLWDSQEQLGVRVGILKPGEAIPYPGSPDGVKQYAAAMTTEKWATSEGNRLRGQAALENAKRDQEKFDIEKPGLEASSLQKRITLAVQTVPDNQSDWEQWLSTMDPDVKQALRPGAIYSPTEQQRMERMGMTAQQRAETDAAAAREARANKPVPGRDIPFPKDVEAQRKRMRPAPANTIVLTPEGLDAAAEQFSKTGQMPALGMGASGMRAQIINRAAVLHPHVDLASNAADYQANKASLSSLQRNRDAIVSFENTANKNLDQFLATAGKIVESGSPLINRPLRTISTSVAGSQNMAAYDAARRVAINEIAKVTSNPNLTGQLSDAARKEVESFVPENATLAQVYAVAKVLKQDMRNRHDALDEQIQAIQSRIGGQTRPAQGGFTVKDPRGVVHTFRTQADADNFKKLAGIQ